MLDPESRNLGFELLELGREHDVMALRKCVVQLGTPLGGALDLELDVFDCSHVYLNVRALEDIPATWSVPTAEEEEEQDACADDAGHDRDHVEERDHYS